MSTQVKELPCGKLSVRQYMMSLEGQNSFVRTLNEKFAEGYVIQLLRPEGSDRPHNRAEWPLFTNGMHVVMYKPEDVVGAPVEVVEAPVEPEPVAETEEAPEVVEAPKPEPKKKKSTKKKTAK